MTHSRLRPLLSGVVLRSQSDARLSELARDGHQLAFTTLFERYQSELGNHAARIVRPGRGDDVVQDAMLKAWSALLSGEDVAEPRAWLHRIVRNVALSTVTRRGYDDTEIPESAASPHLTDDIAERRMSATEALAAVAALPDAQRRALTATALGGRSTTHAAADMGVSQGAMRQLVYRARNGVRSAVTAITPLPLIAAVLRHAGPGGAAAAGGIGTAGALSSVAAKTAVVLAVAAGGAGATTTLSHDRGRHPHARHAQSSAAAPAKPASMRPVIRTTAPTHRASLAGQHPRSGGSGGEHGHHESTNTRGDHGATGHSNASNGTSHSATGTQGSSGATAGESGSTSDGSRDSTPHGAQGASISDNTPGAPPAIEAPVQPEQPDASAANNVDDGASAAPSAG